MRKDLGVWTFLVKECDEVDTFVTDDEERGEEHHIQFMDAILAINVGMFEAGDMIEVVSVNTWTLEVTLSKFRADYQKLDVLKDSPLEDLHTFQLKLHA